MPIHFAHLVLSRNMLKVVLHHHLASKPTKGSVGAIGYDLYSCQDYRIPARKWTAVNTGVSIQMPDGCYGRVAPRSGLTAVYGLDVGAGVIDADFRGMIQVILFNHNDQDYVVKVGDRIAQLILEQALTNVEVVQVEKLDDTERGQGGLGSTGK